MSIPEQRKSRDRWLFTYLFLLHVYTIVIFLVTHIYLLQAIAIAGEKRFVRSKKGSSFSRRGAAFHSFQAFPNKQRFTVYKFYQQTHKYTFKYNKWYNFINYLSIRIYIILSYYTSYRTNNPLELLQRRTIRENIIKELILLYFIS